MWKITVVIEESSELYIFTSHNQKAADTKHKTQQSISFPLVRGKPYIEV